MEREPDAADHVGVAGSFENCILAELLLRAKLDASLIDQSTSFSVDHSNKQHAAAKAD